MWRLAQALCNAGEACSPAPLSPPPHLPSGSRFCCLICVLDSTARGSEVVVAVVVVVVVPPPLLFPASPAPASSVTVSVNAKVACEG